MQNTPIEEISVGVVGLGLMGSSIVAALLVAGHRVIAVAPLLSDMETAPHRIEDQLYHCQQVNLLTRPLAEYRGRLVVSADYAPLAGCRLVLECVVESIDIKRAVYAKIEQAVASDAVIASNTSAIPISLLQQCVGQPDRFLGIHWAEPAYMTRFLEITCGHQTAATYADWVFTLAHSWNKEPTLLRKDIRGFVTNRLMYAVYREAFQAIESKQATLDDIDKALRYDAGSWMTLMGIFRRLDYLGISDYARIFATIFPQLSNEDRVPLIMQRLIDTRAKGTQSVKGLYDYSPDEARHWEEAFARFNQDIYELATQYPSPALPNSNHSL